MNLSSLFSHTEYSERLPNIYKNCVLLQDVGEFKTGEQFFAIGLEEEGPKLHFFRKIKYLTEIGCVYIGDN